MEITETRAEMNSSATLQYIGGTYFGLANSQMVFLSLGRVFSSFGASRCDSQHGRMCLSKMRCYYLYAGFGTAWVPETTGWNLGTDQYESDPASYWCLKAGHPLKTQGRDTEN